MPFDIPSIADTRDLLVALGQALFPDLNFGSRFGYHGKWATFLSGAVGQIHFHVSSTQKDLHPLTAGDGKPINDWGSAIGVERRGPSAARKAEAGRVRGTGGSTVDPGTQLVHPQTGLVFQIANLTTITIPGAPGVDSFYDADIAGVDTGSQTRLEAGEQLVFVGGAPAGIEATVILQSALDEGGFDDEQFGSYRARVLATFSETPSGGSAGDFAKWAVEALPSVAKAYAYPNRPGRGEVDIAAFYAGTGSARALSSQDRDSVKAYIQTKAPFQVAGDGGGLRILVTVTDPQTVEILVVTTGVAAFAFDWQGEGEVLDYDPVTRELQFVGGALPASLRAGHRIIPVGVASGSGVGAQDGRQYKVESISGVDTVILESGPPTDLEADDILYPGGPLVDPIRDAIKAHLNGETVYAGRGQVPIPESSSAPTNSSGPSILGLDVLAEGMGPANPAGVYGKWNGDLLVANLYRIATYKAGVRNITIVSPAADYAPLDDPFPNDDQIHYVTPDVVIIRSA